MTTWRDELVGDIHAEWGAKPVVATLATLNGNAPDARSVVVRQVGGDGTLTIASDARSQKNRQLKVNPSATAVFWFPRLRKQYRIAGMVQIISRENEDDLRRLAAWRELSDSARALFVWPASGEIRRGSDDFPKSIPLEVPAPPCFELLLLTADSVETLDLNPHPHLRVRWMLIAAAWQGTPINP